MGDRLLRVFLSTLLLLRLKLFTVVSADVRSARQFLTSFGVTTTSKPDDKKAKKRIRKIRRSSRSFSTQSLVLPLHFSSLQSEEQKKKKRKAKLKEQYVKKGV